MLGAARCVFVAAQAEAGPVSLGTLAAFGTSRLQVTSLPGWPVGRTPKGVVAQGSCAHGYVRRSWKPADNDGTWMDFQAGWRGSGGSSDTIRVVLDDDSEIELAYTVQSTIPTPQGTGVVRYLDATAASGGDGTQGSPWNDWATAIAGLATDDVLVVGAKPGGGVYVTAATTQGPSSSVDGCKIVADPDDVAAGRRPRIYVRGDVYAEFADLSVDSWDLHADLGSPHGKVYKSKSTITNPGLIHGGMYKAAGGGWGRLLQYTDTDGATGLGLDRLMDTTYARQTKSAGAASFTLYSWPAVYHNPSDDKLYIRLTPINDTTGGKIVDSSGGQPNPPWEWAHYMPESEDANTCELLLSGSETGTDQLQQTSALIIKSTTGWELENIDFIGGGYTVDARGSSLTVRGCRFLATLPQPNAWEDSFAADTPNNRGACVNVEFGSLVAEFCEFWGGGAIATGQDVNKLRWGAWGYGSHVNAVDCEDGDFTARHCLFDDFHDGWALSDRSGNVKLHHCEFRRWGQNGGMVAGHPERYDWLRCIMWDATLGGWTSGGWNIASGSVQNVGFCLWVNARPVYRFSGWWDDRYSEQNQCVPVGLVVGHGSHTEPFDVRHYNCTQLVAPRTLAQFTPAGTIGTVGCVFTNTGNQHSGSSKSSRNCIFAEYDSPSFGNMVEASSRDSIACTLMHDDAEGGSPVLDMDHDFDHFYRDPAASDDPGNFNGVVLTIDSAGTGRARNTIADVTTDTGHEANGTLGDPLFAVTPDYSADDPTLHQVGNYLLATGSPCRTGGATGLSARGWPDVDVDGTEFTYDGHAWRGALEPDVPAVEQQVGPLGPMPSAKD